MLNKSPLKWSNDKSDVAKVACIKSSLHWCTFMSDTQHYVQNSTPRVGQSPTGVDQSQAYAKKLRLVRGCEQSFDTYQMLCFQSWVKK